MYSDSNSLKEDLSLCSTLYNPQSHIEAADAKICSTKNPEKREKETLRTGTEAEPEKEKEGRQIL